MTQTTPQASIAVIAAMTPRRVIGLNNTLPWRIPSDLKRFKALTTGHTVVMGRKTYESIGRPLPNRRNVVVSKTMLPRDGIEVAHSLEHAFDRFNDDATQPIFMMGGGELYAQTMADFSDRVHALYLTIVDADIEGDAFFPVVDWMQWRCNFRARHADAPPPVKSYEYQNWTRV